MDNIEAKIEAILFTMGDAVSVEQLSDVIGHDKNTIRKIIYNMMDRYEAKDRGINIIELDNRFQLCTKKDYYPLIKSIVSKEKAEKLTDVLIETLSIIAYKQPITRAHIEEIRGVNSNHSVNRLLEMRLIHEVGRLDAPGKPILFGTSEGFLRGFGLSSIHELPQINDNQVELIRDEVLKEADTLPEE